MRFLGDFAEFAVFAVLISYFCRHSGQIAVVVEGNMVLLIRFYIFFVAWAGWIGL